MQRYNLPGPDAQLQSSASLQLFLLMVTVLQNVGCLLPLGLAASLPASLLPGIVGGRRLQ